MNMAMPIYRTPVISRLTIKIFGICFIATHAPLILLASYLVAGYSSKPTAVLLTVLVATLIGTLFCLTCLWRLIRPLRDVVAMIDVYRSSGVVKTLLSQQHDEIGRVVNGVSELISELDATLSQLRRQASTDPLTGLGNRRWLRDIGALELQRATREEAPISVILFDLDHFKAINDRHGHEAGDQVLMMTGATIQHNLRPYDIAARIGGEEFCIVLPRTGLKMAISVAERLRRELASKAAGPIKAGAVTASFGVYRGDPTNETLKAMMNVADQQLYRAKNGGRNTLRWRAAPAFSHEMPTDGDVAIPITVPEGLRPRRKSDKAQDTLRDGSGETL